MTDMLSTIIPKSDQKNFDDFISGQSQTITITKVSQVSGDQPISINYEGDNGKPWKPCKSMRRVLVNCWGADGKKYVGRSVTLYGDPKVTFGAQAVGGIRISHMSHIEEPITMALTTSKASRKPFTVHPLAESAPALVVSLEDYISDIAASPTIEGLQHKFSDAQRAYKNHQDFFKVIEAKDKRKTELTTTKG